MPEKLEYFSLYCCKEDREQTGCPKGRIVGECIGLYRNQAAIAGKPCGAFAQSGTVCEYFRFQRDNPSPIKMLGD